MRPLKLRMLSQTFSWAARLGAGVTRSQTGIFLDSSFFVCSNPLMIRRPLRPTFPHALIEDYLAALERTRHFSVQFRSAQKFGSDAMAKADALTDAIDVMAEEQTGDRTHFHLKPHGR